MKLLTLIISLFPLVAFAAGGQHGSHQTTHVSGPAELSKASITSSTFSHDGKLWLAWVFGTDLYVNHSSDHGKTLSTPVKINSDDEVVSNNPEARPNIAIGKDGFVYVSYAEKLKQRFSGHVRFSRSTDNGKTFSTSIIVNDDRQMIGHSFATLAVNTQGHIYIAWLDGRERVAAKAAGEEYTGSAVFYTRSTDQGATFEANAKIADNSCQCCRIAIAMDEHDLPVIVWRHIYNNEIRDHAMVRFTAETTFTAPHQVSDDDWKIESCPHHGPSLAIDAQGRYHMTWFTNGSKRQGVFYAYSDDQGNTFSPAIALGTSKTQAKHAYVLSNQDHVYITWKTFDGETTSVNVMHSTDRGQTWQAPYTAASTQGNSEHPFLARDNEHVYLSWQTANEGFQLLALRSVNANANISPFIRGSYQTIQQQRTAPHIVNLWSIDCPPCRKELVMLNELRKANPTLDVVLISTDAPEYRQEVVDVINELGLTGMELWHFNDAFVERLRYDIDPSWQGELPRSYLHTVNNHVEAISGVIAKDTIISWMQQQASFDVVNK